MLVIIDTSSINLNRQDFPEEKHFDFRTLQAIGDGVCRIPVADAGNVAKIDWTSQRSWPIPRGDGSFFAVAIRRAFLAKSPILLLHSWNCFKDGSFLVPNNFDENLMQNVLYEEYENLDALKDSK